MLARLSALVARRAAAPASLRRALCAPPAPPVVLMETPAVSTRKARIREHGMLGLTTAFIEQQSARGRDASFRVLCTAACIACGEWAIPGSEMPIVTTPLLASIRL